MLRKGFVFVVFLPTGLFLFAGLYLSKGQLWSLKMGEVFKINNFAGSAICFILDFYVNAISLTLMCTTVFLSSCILCFMVETLRVLKVQPPAKWHVTLRLYIYMLVLVRHLNAFTSVVLAPVVTGCYYGEALFNYYCRRHIGIERVYSGALSDRMAFNFRTTSMINVGF